MKLTGLILFVCVCRMCTAAVIDFKRASNPAAAGGGMSANLLAPLTDGIVQLGKQLMGYLSNNLLGDHPFYTVIGRGVRIHSSGNSVFIQDVASGMSVTGTGATVQEAMGDATKKFVTSLLEMGFISVDDLHLAPKITTTEAPCGDNFPPSYCADQKQMGFCSPASAFFTFMNSNCRGTCLGGCN